VGAGGCEQFAQFVVTVHVLWNFASHESGQRHDWLEEKIVAGWSALLGAILKEVLHGPRGLADAGIALNMGGKASIIRGGLSHLVGDGEGWQKAFQWKGAGSLRPCIRHPNVLKIGSDLAHRMAGCVEACCSDAVQFRATDDSELYAKVDLVVSARARHAAGTISDGRLEEISTAAGYNSCRNGLLSMAALRASFSPVKVLNYDWAHTALQDGTLSVAAFLVIVALEGTGVTMRDLRNFVDFDWGQPKRDEKPLRSVKSVLTHSEKSKSKLRASCGELLALYGLLRHYLERKGDELRAIEKEVQVYLAACRAVDIARARAPLFTMRGSRAAQAVFSRAGARYYHGCQNAEAAVGEGCCVVAASARGAHAASPRGVWKRKSQTQTPLDV